MNENGKSTVHSITQAEVEFELGVFPEGTGEPQRVMSRGRNRVRFVL